MVGRLFLPILDFGEWSFIKMVLNIFSCNKISNLDFTQPQILRESPHS